MKKHSINFSVKDQKTRKKWLITMFCILGYDLLTSTAFVLSSGEYKNPLPIIGTLGIYEVVAYGLLYYFAFKKQGYRFLVGFLIGPILKNLPGIQSSFKIESIGDVISLVFIIALFGWWYYVSFKLISINKKYKVKISEPSQECREEITRMRSVQDSEDLDKKFHSLIREFPQYEQAISKEYKKKKNSIALESLASSS